MSFAAGFAILAKMTRRIILITSVLLIIIGAGAFVFRSRLNTIQTGIHIETIPQSVVYIDGRQVGTTPYDGVLDPGEITLRLVPQDTSQELTEWNTRLQLTPGIKTVVKREFSLIESQSSGEILSFEKLSGRETRLTIVSTPDAAQVSLDGEIRGFTPLLITSITEGEHKILVALPGYNDREIQAKTFAGYKLTIMAFLSQSPGAQNQEESVASGSASINDATKRSLVEILETPVGYLRVRSEPNKNASESAKLKPGEQVPFLEEKNDWYRIEYSVGKNGWISAEYAKKIE